MRLIYLTNKPPGWKRTCCFLLAGLALPFTKLRKINVNNISLFSALAQNEWK